MTLPEIEVAVLCDVDTAWKLKEELRASGVPCLFKDEQSFKASYKRTSDVGLLWGYSRAIIPLMSNNATLAVSMPEFRAAFDLTPKPQL